MSPDSPPPPKYEGPFAHRKRARPKKVSLGWLSPWRIYSLGALAALAVTAFYLAKLTLTPDMIIAATTDTPPPPPPPRNTLSAWCLGGAPRRVPPAPFCTPARPPGCRHGEALQLTYTTAVRTQGYVYPLIMGADIRPREIVRASLPVRPGADDAPLAQWKVDALRERTPAALVGIFSRVPLVAADLEGWLDRWRTRERLLSRPPELPQALKARGATLSAFRICLGR